MAVLVIVLIVTNLVTLGAIVLARRTPASPYDPQPGATGRDRRMISIEILNPIELAASRGRVLGIAGSFAPGVTRRVVYDQTVKILKRQLTERGVLADVRVHTLRAARPEQPSVSTAPPAPPHPNDPPVPYLLGPGKAAEPGGDQPPV